MQSDCGRAALHNWDPHCRMPRLGNLGIELRAALCHSQRLAAQILSEFLLPCARLFGHQIIGDDIRDYAGIHVALARKQRGSQSQR